jgi:hypothetical protein
MFVFINMNDTEIVSVHYKTPDYIYAQYNSIRKFYPSIKYRIIDGSDDKKIYFQDLEKKDTNFSVNRFGYNIHHGPGMDHAIKTSNKKFLLILDSDVSLKSPLIDDMLKVFSGYAVGKKIIVNSKGYSSWQTSNDGDNNFIYEYVHPYCMLVNKEEYNKHSPFVKHGAPCIQSMMDIYNKKLTNMLTNFEIENYVNLVTRGTRKIWGINL